MIAQKERTYSRPARAYQTEYSYQADTAPHGTLSMAQAWGRLAARLGWDLDKGLAEEVAPQFHAAARAAYATAKARRA